jgi:dihydrofolate reductase
MGKIVISEFATLDSVVEEPSWTFEFQWSEDQMNFKNQELRNAEGLLLGRVTYQGFAEAWPKMQDDPQGYGKRMNSIPKYVVSNTLERAEWNNSNLVKGDLVKELTKLKESSKGYLLVFGSLQLTRFLIEQHLADELTLWVFPIFLGKGRRIFDGESKARPKLVEARGFGSGTVLLRYEFKHGPNEGGKQRP